MNLERLTRGHVLAAVAALALLLVMATDWYGTQLGNQASRVAASANVSGAESGQLGRAVRSEAEQVAQSQERNAWQEKGTIDRVILALLLATIALSLYAAARRAAGKRYRAPLTPSGLTAMGALVSALLVTYRIFQQPGLDSATTLKAGPLLALAALGGIAVGAGLSLQREIEWDAVRAAARNAGAALAAAPAPKPGPASDAPTAAGQPPIRAPEPPASAEDSRLREPSASRIAELRALYADIHACEKCFGDPRCLMEPDQLRVERKVVARALASRVMLVGPHLGRGTQRLSGLPFIQRDGALSVAGQRLDRFLRSFGYSLHPGGDLPYVYSADLVQRWPGAGNEPDRNPNGAEIENCAEWLDRELELVEPAVVILLGRLAAKTFLARYGGGTDAYEWGMPQSCVFHGRTVPAIPIPHPTARGRSARDLEAAYGQAAESARRVLAQA